MFKACGAIFVSAFGVCLASTSQLLPRPLTRLLGRLGPRLDGVFSGSVRQMPESAGRGSRHESLRKTYNTSQRHPGPPDQNMRPFGWHSRAARREPTSHHTTAINKEPKLRSPRRLPRHDARLLRVRHTTSRLAIPRRRGRWYRSRNAVVRVGVRRDPLGLVRIFHVFFRRPDFERGSCGP